MADLFSAQEAAEAVTKAAAAEQAHKDSWRVIWGWEGPAPGGRGSVNRCVVATADGGTVYCYTESVRFIEQRPDGRWLAEIDMGEVHGEPWPKDGTRLLLATWDIWPDVRGIIAARNEARTIETATTGATHES